MERASPIDAATQIVKDRYPSASVAILAGSVTAGRATPTSDLDLVVIAPGDPAVPFRESFYALGWPVEAFVHDEKSLNGFFDLDLRSSECTLATMVATGVVVVDAGGSASRLRDHAAALIAAGPPPASDDDLSQLRYFVNDMLDDLRGDPLGDESTLVAPNLASDIAALVLMSHRSWQGGDKWLLRNLRTADRELADQLVLALRAHQGGDAAPLIALAEQVLAMTGGEAFDGYRSSGKPLLDAQHDS
jgi:Nucleotidyltransferase domain